MTLHIVSCSLTIHFYLLLICFGEHFLFGFGLSENKENAYSYNNSGNNDSFSSSSTTSEFSTLITPSSLPSSSSSDDLDLDLDSDPLQQNSKNDSSMTVGSTACRLTECRSYCVGINSTKGYCLNQDCVCKIEESSCVNVDCGEHCWNTLGKRGYCMYNGCNCIGDSNSSEPTSFNSSAESPTTTTPTTTFSNKDTAQILNPEYMTVTQNQDDVKSTTVVTSVDSVLTTTPSIGHTLVDVSTDVYNNNVTSSTDGFLNVGPDEDRRFLRKSKKNRKRHFGRGRHKKGGKRMWKKQKHRNLQPNNR